MVYFILNKLKKGKDTVHDQGEREQCTESRLHNHISSINTVVTKTPPRARPDLNELLTKLSRHAMSNTLFLLQEQFYKKKIASFLLKI